MGVVDDLAKARDAFERREWESAYRGLLNRDDLPPDDLPLLATAAYLSGHRDECLRALQKAYQQYLNAGDVRIAVRCGFWLAMVYVTSGAPAVGAGWVTRCERLLDSVGGDPVERGYLLMLLMYRHIFTGEFEDALRLAGEVTDYGRRHADADLLANGLNAQGRMLLYSGRVPEGLALLDEAMVGVSAGEVSPIIAGQVYCSLIEACQEISDFGRAAEWTRVLTAWIDGQPGLVMFTGQCAVHRGQLLRLHGDYAVALEELDLACQRYLVADTEEAAALAMTEAGEIHRLRGEREEAEATFARAVELGHDPQPALAQLWLDLGRAPAALAAIRRLLTEVEDPVHRSQLLPGAVEVLLGTGQTDDAMAATGELTAIADSFGSVALKAMAHYATACCLLAQGQPAESARELRAAQPLWQGLGATFEMARCRLQLGRALHDLADEESATAQLVAARRTFEELGARPAALQAAKLLSPATPGGLTGREIEVLRLVAAGRTNPQIAATLVLSEKTVARHLSNIFTKIDVGSRAAATAFAYEQHLV